MLKAIQSKKANLLIRTISFITALIFTANSVLWADGGTLLNTPSIDLPAVSKQIAKDFSLPAELGEVKEVFRGSQEQTVLMIQDAHANEEAQRSIAGILNYFSSKNGLNLVHLEGASDLLDTKIFGLFPNMEVKKMVAGYFLKEARLTGPEYLAMIDRPDIQLQGVEEQKLYEENRAAYLNALEFKPRDEKILKRLDKILKDLARFIFSPEAVDFQNRRRAFRDAGEGIYDYIDYLEVKAREKNIDTSAMPQLKALSEASKLHSGINFSLAEEQIEKLAVDFQKILTPEERDALWEATIRYKTGKLDGLTFFKSVSDTLRTAFSRTDETSAESLRAEHANLLSYMKYMSLQESIDVSIFDEIAALEKNIEDTVLVTEEQKTLGRLFHVHGIMTKLFDFGLTKQDADFFYANRGEFTSGPFKDFIAPMIPKYNFSEGLPENMEILDTDIPEIEKFYAAAVKRDHVLIDNTILNMKEKNKSVSAIVTGGFHTPGMRAYLREKSYSYFIIMPRVEKIDHEKENELYENSLRQKPLPLEKMLIEADLSKPALANDPRFQLSAMKMILSRAGWAEIAKTLEENGRGGLSWTAEKMFADMPDKAHAMDMITRLMIMTLFEANDPASVWADILSSASQEPAFVSVLEEMFQGSEILRDERGSQYFVYPTSDGENFYVLAQPGTGVNAGAIKDHLGIRALSAEMSGTVAGKKWYMAQVPAHLVDGLRMRADQTFELTGSKTAAKTTAKTSKVQAARRSELRQFPANVLKMTPEKIEKAERELRWLQKSFRNTDILTFSADEKNAIVHFLASTESMVAEGQTAGMVNTPVIKTRGLEYTAKVRAWIDENARAIFQLRKKNRDSIGLLREEFKKVFKAINAKLAAQPGAVSQDTLISADLTARYLIAKYGASASGISTTDFWGGPAFNRIKAMLKLQDVRSFEYEGSVAAKIQQWRAAGIIPEELGAMAEKAWAKKMPEEQKRAEEARKQAEEAKKKAEEDRRKAEEERRRIEAEQKRQQEIELARQEELKRQAEEKKKLEEEKRKQNEKEILAMFDAVQKAVQARIAEFRAAEEGRVVPAQGGNELVPAILDLTNASQKLKELIYGWFNEEMEKAEARIKANPDQAALYDASAKKKISDIIQTQITRSYQGAVQVFNQKLQQYLGVYQPYEDILGDAKDLIGKTATLATAQSANEAGEAVLKKLEDLKARRVEAAKLKNKVPALWQQSEQEYLDAERQLKQVLEKVRQFFINEMIKRVENYTLQVKDMLRLLAGRQQRILPQTVTLGRVNILLAEQNKILEELAVIEQKTAEANLGWAKSKRSAQPAVQAEIKKFNDLNADISKLKGEAEVNRDFLAGLQTARADVESMYAALEADAKAALTQLGTEAVLESPLARIDVSKAPMDQIERGVLVFSKEIKNLRKYKKSLPGNLSVRFNGANETIPEAYRKILEELIREKQKEIEDFLNKKISEYETRLNETLAGFTSNYKPYSVITARIDRMSRYLADLSGLNVSDLLGFSGQIKELLKDLAVRDIEMRLWLLPIPETEALRTRLEADSAVLEKKLTDQEASIRTAIAARRENSAALTADIDAQARIFRGRNANRTARLQEIQKLLAAANADIPGLMAELQEIQNQASADQKQVEAYARGVSASPLTGEDNVRASLREFERLASPASENAKASQNLQQAAAQALTGKAAAFVSQTQAVLVQAEQIIRGSDQSAIEDEQEKLTQAIASAENLLDELNRGGQQTAAVETLLVNLRNQSIEAGKAILGLELERSLTPSEQDLAAMQAEMDAAFAERRQEVEAIEQRLRDADGEAFREQIEEERKLIETEQKVLAASESLSAIVMQAEVETLKQPVEVRARAERQEKKDASVRKTRREKEWRRQQREDDLADERLDALSKRVGVRQQSRELGRKRAEEESRRAEFIEEREKQDAEARIADLDAELEMKKLEEEALAKQYEQDLENARAFLRDEQARIEADKEAALQVLAGEAEQIEAGRRKAEADAETAWQREYAAMVSDQQAQERAERAAAIERQREFEAEKERQRLAQEEAELPMAVEEVIEETLELLPPIELAPQAEPAVVRPPVVTLQVNRNPDPASRAEKSWLRTLFNKLFGNWGMRTRRASSSLDSQVGRSAFELNQLEEKIAASVTPVNFQTELIRTVDFETEASVSSISVALPASTNDFNEADSLFAVRLDEAPLPALQIFDLDNMYSVNLEESAQPAAAVSPEDNVFPVINVIDELRRAPREGAVAILQDAVDPAIVTDEAVRRQNEGFISAMLPKFFDKQDGAGFAFQPQNETNVVWQTQLARIQGALQAFQSSSEEFTATANFLTGNGPSKTLYDAIANSTDGGKTSGLIFSFLQITKVTNGRASLEFDADGNGILNQADNAVTSIPLAQFGGTVKFFNDNGPGANRLADFLAGNVPPGSPLALIREGMIEGGERAAFARFFLLRFFDYTNPDTNYSFNRGNTSAIDFVLDSDLDRVLTADGRPANRIGELTVPDAGDLNMLRTPVDRFAQALNFFNDPANSQDAAILAAFLTGKGNVIVPGGGLDLLLQEITKDKTGNVSGALINYVVELAMELGGRKLSDPAPGIDQFDRTHVPLNLIAQALRSLNTAAAAGKAQTEIDAAKTGTPADAQTPEPGTAQPGGVKPGTTVKPGTQGQTPSAGTKGGTKKTAPVFLFPTIEPLAPPIGGLTVGASIFTGAAPFTGGSSGTSVNTQTFTPISGMGSSDNSREQERPDSDVQTVSLGTGGIDNVEVEIFSTQGKDETVFSLKLTIDGEEKVVDLLSLDNDEELELHLGKGNLNDDGTVEEGITTHGDNLVVVRIYSTTRTGKVWIIVIDKKTKTIFKKEVDTTTEVVVKGDKLMVGIEEAGKVEAVAKSDQDPGDMVMPFMDPILVDAAKPPAQAPAQDKEIDDIFDSFLGVNVDGGKEVEQGLEISYGQSLLLAVIAAGGLAGGIVLADRVTGIRQEVEKEKKTPRLNFKDDEKEKRSEMRMTRRSFLAAAGASAAGLLGIGSGTKAQDAGDQRDAGLLKMFEDFKSTLDAVMTKRAGKPVSVNLPAGTFIPEFMTTIQKDAGEQALTDMKNVPAGAPSGYLEDMKKIFGETLGMPLELSPAIATLTEADWEIQFLNPLMQSMGFKGDKKKEQEFVKQFAVDIALTKTKLLQFQKAGKISKSSDVPSPMEVWISGALEIDQWAELNKHWQASAAKPNFNMETLLGIALFLTRQEMERKKLAQSLYLDRDEFFQGLEATLPASEISPANRITQQKFAEVTARYLREAAYTETYDELARKSGNAAFSGADILSREQQRLGVMLGGLDAKERTRQSIKPGPFSHLTRDKSHLVDQFELAGIVLPVLTGSKALWIAPNAKPEEIIDSKNFNAIIETYNAIDKSGALDQLYLPYDNPVLLKMLLDWRAGKFELRDSLPVYPEYFNPDNYDLSAFDYTKAPPGTQRKLEEMKDIIKRTTDQSQVRYYQFLIIKELLKVAVNTEVSRKLFWIRYGVENGMVKIDRRNPETVKVNIDGLLTKMRNMRELVPFVNRFVGRTLNLNEPDDMGFLAAMENDMTRKKVLPRYYNFLIFLASEPNVRASLRDLLYELTGNERWKKDFNFLDQATGAVQTGFVLEVVRNLAVEGWEPRILRNMVNFIKTAGREQAFKLVNEFWGTMGTLMSAKVNKFEGDFLTWTSQMQGRMMAFLKLGASKGWRDTYAEYTAATNYLKEKVIEVDSKNKNTAVRDETLKNAALLEQSVIGQGRKVDYLPLTPASVMRNPKSQGVYISWVVEKARADGYVEKAVRQFQTEVNTKRSEMREGMTRRTFVKAGAATVATVAVPGIASANLSGKDKKEKTVAESMFDLPQGIPGFIPQGPLEEKFEFTAMQGEGPVKPAVQAVTGATGAEGDWSEPIQKILNDSSQREELLTEAALLQQILGSPQKLTNADIQRGLEKQDAHIRGLVLGWAKTRVEGGWEETRGLAAKLLELMKDNDKKEEIMNEVQSLADFQHGKGFIKVRESFAKPGEDPAMGNMARGLIISWARFRISQSAELEDSWDQSSGVAGRIMETLKLIDGSKEHRDAFFGTVLKLFYLDRNDNTPVPDTVKLEDFRGSEDRWNFLTGILASMLMEFKQGLSNREGPEISDLDKFTVHTKNLYFMLLNSREDLEKYYTGINRPMGLDSKTRVLGNRRFIWGEYAARLKMIEEIYGRYDLTEEQISSTLRDLARTQKAARDNWRELEDSEYVYYYRMFFLGRRNGEQLTEPDKTFSKLRNTLDVESFFKLISFIKRADLAAGNDLVRELREWQRDPKLRPDWLTANDVEDMIKNIEGEAGKSNKGLKNRNVIDGEAVTLAIYFMLRQSSLPERERASLDKAQEQFFNNSRKEIFLQSIYMAYHQDSKTLTPERMPRGDLAPYLNLINSGVRDLEDIGSMFKYNGILKAGLEEDLADIVIKELKELGVTVNRKELISRLPQLTRDQMIGIPAFIRETQKLDPKKIGPTDRDVKQHIKDWIKDVGYILALNWQNSESKELLHFDILNFAVDLFRDGEKTLASKRRITRQRFASVFKVDISYRDFGKTILGETELKDNPNYSELSDVTLNQLRRLRFSYYVIYKKFMSQSEEIWWLKQWKLLEQALKAAGITSPGEIETQQREFLARMFSVQGQFLETLENTARRAVNAGVGRKPSREEKEAKAAEFSNIAASKIINSLARLSAKEARIKAKQQKVLAQEAILDKYTAELEKRRLERIKENQLLLTDAAKKQKAVVEIREKSRKLGVPLTNGEINFLINKMAEIGYGVDEVLLRFIQLPRVEFPRIYEAATGNRLDKKMDPGKISAFLDPIFKHWGFVNAADKDIRDAINAELNTLAEKGISPNRTIEDAVADELNDLKTRLELAEHLAEELRNYGGRFEKRAERAGLANRVAADALNGGVSKEDLTDWIELSTALAQKVKEVAGNALDREALFRADVLLQLGVAELYENPEYKPQEREQLKKEIAKILGPILIPLNDNKKPGAFQDLFMAPTLSGTISGRLRENPNLINDIVEAVLDRVIRQKMRIHDIDNLRQEAERIAGIIKSIKEEGKTRPLFSETVAPVQAVNLLEALMYIDLTESNPQKRLGLMGLLFPDQPAVEVERFKRMVSAGVNEAFRQNEIQRFDKIAPMPEEYKIFKWLNVKEKGFENIINGAAIIAGITTLLRVVRGALKDPLKGKVDNLKKWSPNQQYRIRMLMFNFLVDFATGFLILWNLAIFMPYVITFSPLAAIIFLGITAYLNRIFPVINVSQTIVYPQVLLLVGAWGVLIATLFVGFPAVLAAAMIIFNYPVLIGVFAIHMALLVMTSSWFKRLTKSPNGLISDQEIYDKVKAEGLFDRNPNIPLTDLPPEQRRPTNLLNVADDEVVVEVRPWLPDGADFAGFVDKLDEVLEKMAMSARGNFDRKIRFILQMNGPLFEPQKLADPNAKIKFGNDDANAMTYPEFFAFIQKKMQPYWEEFVWTDENGITHGGHETLQVHIQPPARKPFPGLRQFDYNMWGEDGTPGNFYGQREYEFRTNLFNQNPNAEGAWDPADWRPISFKKNGITYWIGLPHLAIEAANNAALANPGEKHLALVPPLFKTPMYVGIIGHEPGNAFIPWSTAQNLDFMEVYKPRSPGKPRVRYPNVMDDTNNFAPGGAIYQFNVMQKMDPRTPGHTPQFTLFQGRTDYILPFVDSMATTLWQHQGQTAHSNLWFMQRVWVKLMDFIRLFGKYGGSTEAFNELLGPKPGFPLGLYYTRLIFFGGVLARRLEDKTLPPGSSTPVPVVQTQEDLDDVLKKITFGTFNSEDEILSYSSEDGVAIWAHEKEKHKGGLRGLLNRIPFIGHRAPGDSLSRRVFSGVLDRIASIKNPPMRAISPGMIERPDGGPIIIDDRPLGEKFESDRGKKWIKVFDFWSMVAEIFAHVVALSHRAHMLASLVVRGLFSEILFGTLLVMGASFVLFYAGFMEVRYVQAAWVLCLVTLTSLIHSKATGPFAERMQNLPANKKSGIFGAVFGMIYGGLLAWGLASLAGTAPVIAAGVIIAAAAAGIILGALKMNNAVIAMLQRFFFMPWVLLRVLVWDMWQSAGELGSSNPAFLPQLVSKPAEVGRGAIDAYRTIFYGGAGGAWNANIPETSTEPIWQYFHLKSMAFTLAAGIGIVFIGAFVFQLPVIVTVLLGISSGSFISYLIYSSDAYQGQLKLTREFTRPEKSQALLPLFVRAAKNYPRAVLRGIRDFYRVMLFGITPNMKLDNKRKYENIKMQDWVYAKFMRDTMVIAFPALALTLLGFFASALAPLMQLHWVLLASPILFAFFVSPFAAFLLGMHFKGELKRLVPLVNWALGFSSFAVAAALHIPALQPLIGSYLELMARIPLPVAASVTAGSTTLPMGLLAPILNVSAVFVFIHSFLLAAQVLQLVFGLVLSAIHSSKRIVTLAKNSRKDAAYLLALGVTGFAIATGGYFKDRQKASETQIEQNEGSFSARNAVLNTNDWRIDGAVDNGPDPAVIQTSFGDKTRSFSELKVRVGEEGMFSIKGNGYIRVRQPGKEWGTSFVLTGYWSEGQYLHNPRITELKASYDASQDAAVLEGKFEDVDGRLGADDLKIVLRKDGTMDVSFILKAKKDFSIDQDRITKGEGLRVLQFSSMNVGKTQDADTALFMTKDGQRRVAKSNPGGFTFPGNEQMKPGTPFILLNRNPVKGRETGGMFIQPDFPAIPQGFTTDLKDPNEDNWSLQIQPVNIKPDYKAGETIGKFGFTIGAYTPPAARSEMRQMPGSESFGAAQEFNLRRMLAVENEAAGMKMNLVNALSSLGPELNKNFSDPSYAQSTGLYVMEWQDQYDLAFLNQVAEQVGQGVQVIVWADVATLDKSLLSAAAERGIQIESRVTGQALDQFLADLLKRPAILRKLGKPADSLTQIITADAAAQERPEYLKAALLSAAEISEGRLIVAGGSAKLQMNGIEVESTSLTDAVMLAVEAQRLVESAA